MSKEEILNEVHFVITYLSDEYGRAALRGDGARFDVILCDFLDERQEIWECENPSDYWRGYIAECAELHILG
jgi:hypothetical protein